MITDSKHLSFLTVSNLFMNFLFLCLFSISNFAFAIQPDLKNLPRGLAPFESKVTLDRHRPLTAHPTGPIYSLGEWEDSDAVMTLWTNSSLVNALSEHGFVKLLADSASSQNWWENFVQKNDINADKVSYFVVPTNSIWIRDYGPWFIVDGSGKMGIVDTKYNRPRPKDDVVPKYIAQKQNLPIYQPSLVHTGGNFYSDSISKAFSSTLVFRENRHLTKDEIFQRMFDFLGIEAYTTSDLGVQITIEHLDTFGKLVAPDTWVFSDFPEGSVFKKDSERMVDLLKSQVSPYGTPYRIHRMKMIPTGSSTRQFRAYINSFISNRTLYFPTYGNDNYDEDAKRIYQEALPGYKIVGVQSLGTLWGDSVHCRTRNLMKPTLFLFPKVHELSSSQKVGSMNARIFPTPGHQLIDRPEVLLSVNQGDWESFYMHALSETEYVFEIPIFSKGSQVSMILKAQDSSGAIKTAPLQAPIRTIDWVSE